MNKINITNDLLVSLKNGYSNKNKYIYCKMNKFCLNILWILYKEGLIYDFKVLEEAKKIRVKLKYIKTKPLLTNIKLISKPSLRKFVNFHDLNKFSKQFDYFFLSTSNGIISSKILLKDIKIGGQVLFGFKINN